MTSQYLCRSTYLPKKNYEHRETRWIRIRPKVVADMTEVVSDSVGKCRRFDRSCRRVDRCCRRVGCRRLDLSPSWISPIRLVADFTCIMLEYVIIITVMSYWMPLYWCLCRQSTLSVIMVLFICWVHMYMHTNLVISNVYCITWYLSEMQTSLNKFYFNWCLFHLDTAFRRLFKKKSRL